MNTVSFRYCLAAMALCVLLGTAQPSLCADLTDDALVEQVMAIYDPASTADTSGYSGTSLVKLVERRWDKLSKEHQKRLVHYLDEPVAHGPGAPDGQKSFDTEHFTIIYQTKGPDACADKDADGNGIADYADEVATYLEKAWTVQVETFGFAPPPGADTNKVRCHIKSINHNGLTHAATGKTAWIEINSDIEAYTKRVIGEDAAQSIVADPEGIQAGMLKACCAHEFFHCIQAAYDWDEQNWWCEGTAEWAGDAVFPESKFWTNNVTPRYESPHVTLFSKEGWYEYASSLWAFFLAENYGGAETIKAIWEGCKDGTVQAATSEAVGDLEELFMYYACYNYLRAYADGSRFPTMRVIDIEAATTIDSAGIDSAQYFGANYFVVAGDVTNSIDVTVNQGGSGDVRLITISDGRWKILPHKLDGGTLHVDFADTTALEKVIVVVASFQLEGELAYKVTVK